MNWKGVYMRHFRCAVLLCFLLPGTLAYTADSGGRDGTIVKQEACPARKFEYEDFVQLQRTDYEEEMQSEPQSPAKIGVSMPSLQDYLKALPDRATVEKRKAHHGYECLKVTYLSDGLNVIGFIFKPVDSKGKKLPVVIFNRGGEGDNGKVTANRIFLWQYEFLEQGFVILAAQLRGVDGGEGQDEFGGRDLDDVLNLIPLAQSLDYVDTKNVFMYGVSRGGTMTYLAIKKGASINAAAVHAGPTDLTDQLRLRPDFSKVYEEYIPDYKTNPSEALSQRSAIDWPDKINTPVLLLHGTADWRVSPNDALRLAMKLQQLHKTYALQIYANDVHALTMHNDEVHLRIIEWFRQYMK